MKFIRKLLLGTCLISVPTMIMAANCQTQLEDKVYLSPEMTLNFLPDTALPGACINVSNANTEGSFDIFISFKDLFPAQYGLSCSCMSKGKVGKLKPDASKRFTCVGEQSGGGKLLTMSGEVVGKTGKVALKKLHVQFEGGDTAVMSNTRRPLGLECT